MNSSCLDLQVDAVGFRARGWPAIKPLRCWCCNIYNISSISQTDWPSNFGAHQLSRHFAPPPRPLCATQVPRKSWRSTWAGQKAPRSNAGAAAGDSAVFGHCHLHLPMGLPSHHRTTGEEDELMPWQRRVCAKTFADARGGWSVCVGTLAYLRHELIVAFVFVTLYHTIKGIVIFIVIIIVIIPYDPYYSRY